MTSADAHPRSDDRGIPVMLRPIRTKSARKEQSQLSGRVGTADGRRGSSGRGGGRDERDASTAPVTGSIHGEGTTGESSRDRETERERTASRDRETKRDRETERDVAAHVSDGNVLTSQGRQSSRNERDVRGNANYGHGIKNGSIQKEGKGFRNEEERALIEKEEALGTRMTGERDSNPRYGATEQQYQQNQQYQSIEQESKQSQQKHVKFQGSSINSMNSMNSMHSRRAMKAESDGHLRSSGHRTGEPQNGGQVTPDPPSPETRNPALEPEGWRRRAAVDQGRAPSPSLVPLGDRAVSYTASTSGTASTNNSNPREDLFPLLQLPSRNGVQANMTYSLPFNRTQIAHSLPQLAPSESPLNPGANSIYRSWPPEVPAPGWTSPVPKSREGASAAAASSAAAPAVSRRLSLHTRPTTGPDQPRAAITSWKSNSLPRNRTQQVQHTDSLNGAPQGHPNDASMSSSSTQQGLINGNQASQLGRSHPSGFSSSSPSAAAVSSPEGPAATAAGRSNPPNEGGPANAANEGAPSSGPLDDSMQARVMSSNSNRQNPERPPAWEKVQRSMFHSPSVGHWGQQHREPPPAPSKKPLEKHRRAVPFWMALLCLLFLLWGLRESDRVLHLKGELEMSLKKQQELAQYIRTQKAQRQPILDEDASRDAAGTGSSVPLSCAFTGEGALTGNECRSGTGEGGVGRVVVGGEKDVVGGEKEVVGNVVDAPPVGSPPGDCPVLEGIPSEGADGSEGSTEVDHLQLRRLAFFCLLLLLLIPILLAYYMDDLPSITSWLVGRKGDEAGGLSSTGGGDVAFSKRLVYKVDVWFSSYSWVKSAALLVATLVLIAYGGLALYAVGGDEGLPLTDATWRSWTYVADAGNHADSMGLGPRIVSVCVSFGGMLIFALMVGLVTETISEKVDSLRKGRSDVIENNHTLVLGWSDKLGSLIKQLALANESEGGGVVVVMAEMEKEDMENEIHKMELDLLGTSVICRSGSALVPADLKKVNVSAARSIVILAEEDNADAADAHALRVVLSLCGMREGLRGHIVVELSDVDSDQLVKMVGGQIVETVVAHDVIGRLMIQCARQPGLAQIWETLLGFENCEFYSKHWPELEGRTFREVVVSFPEAVPIGLKVQGYMVLNPNDDYVLQSEDEVLVIAEDDDSYAPAAPPEILDVPLPEVFIPPKLPEKILFCGWRRDIDDMIVVLEAFLARGSELWIFSHVPIEEREERLIEGGLNPGELENMTLVHRQGNAVIRRHLETLPMETFDSILILADEDHEDSTINCDSRSLATLLLIRDIQSKRIPQAGHQLDGPAPTGAGATFPRQQGERGRSSSNHSSSSWIRQMQQASQKSIVISEILDSRTRSLVSVSQISDYVLSNELVSMALAMVAEDRAINQVISELFAEEGNEMYIRPGELYLHPNEEASFFELMIRARRRKEIMIGYKRSTEETAVINPPDKGVVMEWSLSDAFVVLAFEE